MKKVALLTAVSAALALPAVAAEGMWPYNMAPANEVATAHGFTMTPEWLNHAMLSSVRFNNGGSGSFVSPNGLVMTNHHVGADCIAKLSQASNDADYMADGFTAATEANEQKCPDLELNQLREVVDVTAKVEAAVAGSGAADDAAKNKARKSEMSRIEKECADSSGMRCDVVTLYSGGAYHLYTYKKYTDVRLVFAPEFKTAFFGGDQDNFTYPRMCMDVAFFRVYEADSAGAAKPIESARYFPFSEKGAGEGDLVFVSGNPGSTDRFSTTAELKHLRDHRYGFLLELLEGMHTMLGAYMAKGDEQNKAARDDFFGVENSIKAIKGYVGGLRDPALMAAAEKRQSDLKAKLESLPPSDKARLLEAWPKLEGALATYGTFFKQHAVTERFIGRVMGKLTNVSRHLLRMGDELPKANEERLREYRESNIASLELQLFSEAPIDDGLETEKIALGLQWMSDVLGAADPVVVAALAGKSPKDRAAELVAGTKLKDVAFRRQLRDGGKAAVDAAKDPMIEFVRSFDGKGRALRKRYEDEVESVEKLYSGRIAEAWAKAYGAQVYPDATFTLRINHGVVKGFTEDDGTKVAWRTQAGDLYIKNKRAGGKDPYALAQSWQDAIGRVDFTIPFNFVSTNDIIGGNSGSPVFNTKGEIVGIVFDGNLHMLPNRFVYREEQGRAVSVHSSLILHALEQVYRAERLAKELRP